MATPANWEDDDEWELINDDGFVYKRKKRPPAITSSSATAPSLPDPAVEENNRRERKKRALLKLKHKYQREIDQWVLLSNTLKEMQQKSQIISHQQKSRQLNDDTTSSDHVTTTSLVPPSHSSGSTCRQLVDELLLQAEAQNSIIQDVARLCDIAEALCTAREESFKKSFTELPIWAAKPHELITSLSED